MDDQKSRLKRSIDEAYNLLFELKQQMLVSYDPVERSRLKLSIERTQEQVDGLQADLDRINSRPPASQPTLPQQKPSNDSATPANRPLNLFLAYSPDDVDKVYEVYERLKKDGMHPWMADEDLLGGQTFETEFAKQIEKADLVLVFLSGKAVSQSGQIHRQIRMALREAELQPESSIHVIPIKLEEMEIDSSLRHLTSVNLYPNIDRGYDRLLRSLKARQAQLGNISDSSNPTPTAAQGSSTPFTDSIPIKVKLSTDDREKLTEILIGFTPFSSSPRNFLIGTAGLPDVLVNNMRLQQDNLGVLASDVVSALENYGKLHDPPHPYALAVLINALLNKGVGFDQTNSLKGLLQKYNLNK